MWVINLDKYEHIKVIRIQKEDTVIFEKMNEYSLEDTFPVACIFKSFLSTLVGIAIKEGKVKSIDSRIIDYYPTSKYIDSRWTKLTIKHVLANTSGLEWPGPDETLPMTMNEVFQLSFCREPGTEFLYKPDPQIVIYLLEDLYQMSIVHLIDEKLMKPFECDHWSWNREDVQGMQCSVKILESLGQLYLQKGVWNGKQLFTEEYYEQSLNKYSGGGFPEFLPYGLGWWIGMHGGVKYQMAAGFGGQILCIIPQFNIILTVLSSMERPHPENKEIIIQLIEAVR